MNSAKIKSPEKRLPEKIFGVKFRRPKLLHAALLHPSYRNETACEILEDFDRLEFFGDSILNFVVCRKLYRQYPKANEGLLTRLRSILVSRKILARVASSLALGRQIHIGKSLRQRLHLSREKILADSLEALFAAIYFDRGFSQAETFILKQLASYFDAKRLLRLDPNPKSTLQELSQKQWQAIPAYASEVTAEGVRTVVSVTASRSAAATARTRRIAEERAARLLIRKIRQELLRRPKRNSSGRKLRKIF